MNNRSHDILKMRKIPIQDQTLLFASVYINNFKRAVEELVYNSLDAESTSIAIRVNVQENIIQILDNGSGIDKSNFKLIGQKYCTSKFVDITTLKSTPEKYGFRGVSLASIIEISREVKISSKFHNSDETWIKTFYKSKEMNVSPYTSRPSKGTTVDVSGFLYNLHIQRRSIDSINELQNLKLFFQQLSLVHCNVSISLRDDSKNEIIFTINKNRNVYQTLRTLFGIQQNDVYDLQVEKNLYRVKAYITKDVKKFQWIYLNGRIISKSVLHKAVNELFNKVIASTIFKPTKNKNMNIDENKLFSKSIPCYFLFVTCPYFDYDIAYKCKETVLAFKNWQEIQKLLGKLIQFYSGDTTSTILYKTKNIQQNNDDTLTRKKVKEIMENILNNDSSKQCKITNLNKEIKGKNVKRKNGIQKLQNVMFKKNIISKNRDIENRVDLDKIRDPKTETVLSNKDKITVDSTLLSKCLNLKKKQIVSHSLHRYDTPSKKFKKQNDERKNKHDKKYENTKTKPSMTVRHNKSNNIFKCEHLNLDKNLIPRTKINNNNIFNNINNQLHNELDVKTTYDLVKPITDFQSQEPTNKNKRFVIQEQSQSYFTSESVHPLSTFNSHDYIHQARSVRQNIMKQFITKSASDNFDQHDNFITQEKFLYQKNDNNSIFVNQNINISTHVNELKENKVADGYANTPNVLNFDSKEKKKSINHLNNKHSSVVDFHCEHTYSIDTQNSLFINSCKYNKTYSIQTCNNWANWNKSQHSLTLFNDHTRDETPNNMYDINNIRNNSIIISESQSLEPIDFCETVFRSDNCSGIRKEFNTSPSSKNQIEESGQLYYNKDGQENVHNEHNIRSNKNKSNVIDINENITSDHFIEEIRDENKDDIKNLDETTKVKNDNIKHIAMECANINNFKLKSRHHFVPKGMSQIFNISYKVPCAIGNEQDYYTNDIYKNFEDEVLNNIKIFEPDIKNIKDVVTKEFKNLSNKLNKENADLIFDCTSLENAEVLGQVDGKFILGIIQGRTSTSTRTSKFLAIFDQHAVDERVRLENNLKDYFNGSEWTSVSIDSMLKFKLGQEDSFYVFNHKEKFGRFGLQWTFTNDEILIHAIPAAILGKNFREDEIIMKAVKNLIAEQIDVIKTLKGNVLSHPKSIMDLVFSEACRYAIKFGDKLSKCTCVNMIKALSACRTPFQCAHGRPVMAILMEITDIKTIYTVNFNKIKGFKRLSNCKYKNEMIIKYTK